VLYRIHTMKCVLDYPCLAMHLPCKKSPIFKEIGDTMLSYVMN